MNSASIGEQAVNRRATTSASQKKVVAQTNQHGEDLLCFNVYTQIGEAVVKTCNLRVNSL
jgi:hypothetical protein